MYLLFAENLNNVVNEGENIESFKGVSSSPTLLPNIEEDESNNLVQNVASNNNNEKHSGQLPTQDTSSSLKKTQAASSEENVTPINLNTQLYSIEKDNQKTLPPHYEQSTNNPVPSTSSADKSSISYFTKDEQKQDNITATIVVNVDEQKIENVVTNTSITNVAASKPDTPPESNPISAEMQSNNNEESEPSTSNYKKIYVEKSSTVIQVISDGSIIPIRDKSSSDYTESEPQTSSSYEESDENMQPEKSHENAPLHLKAINLNATEVKEQANDKNNKTNISTLNITLAPAQKISTHVEIDASLVSNDDNVEAKVVPNKESETKPVVLQERSSSKKLSKNQKKKLRKQALKNKNKRKESSTSSSMESDSNEKKKSNNIKQSSGAETNVTVEKSNANEQIATTSEPTSSVTNHQSLETVESNVVSVIEEARTSEIKISNVANVKEQIALVSIEVDSQVTVTEPDNIKQNNDDSTTKVNSESVQMPVAKNEAVDHHVEEIVVNPKVEKKKKKHKRSMPPLTPDAMLGLQTKKPETETVSIEKVHLPEPVKQERTHLSESLSQKVDKENIVVNSLPIKEPANINEAATNETGSSSKEIVESSADVNNVDENNAPKTSTTVQVAQSTRSTISVSQKRPSRIPIARQKSIKHVEQKSDNETKGESVKSNVRTKIPQVTQHKNSSLPEENTSVKTAAPIDDPAKTVLGQTASEENAGKSASPVKDFPALASTSKALKAETNKSQKDKSTSKETREETKEGNEGQILNPETLETVTTVVQRVDESEGSEEVGLSSESEDDEQERGVINPTGGGDEATQTVQEIDQLVKQSSETSQEDLISESGSEFEAIIAANLRHQQSIEQILLDEMNERQMSARRQRAVNFAATKKSSIDSTTSSKQLSYTKSLDNDSESSVSDSNIDELLDRSDSFEEFDEFDDVQDQEESGTDDYNNFEDENQRMVKDMEINLTEINAKVNQLTVNLNAQHGNLSKPMEYIEETCESDEYVSESDEEEGKDLHNSKEDGVVFKEELTAELNVEIKQPTELEVMEV